MPLQSGSNKYKWFTKQNEITQTENRKQANTIVIRDLEIIL